MGAPAALDADRSSASGVMRVRLPRARRGRYRPGRPLRAPPGRATRPTSDRVREAMFSMLTSMDAVDGAPGARPVRRQRRPRHRGPVQRSGVGHPGRRRSGRRRRHPGQPGGARGRGGRPGHRRAGGRPAVRGQRPLLRTWSWSIRRTASGAGTTCWDRWRTGRDCSWPRPGASGNRAPDGRL